MKLSEERKQQILNSLKEDYVPCSDIYADTFSDMLMVKALEDLVTAYLELSSEKYEQVEEVLTLQDKYQKLISDYYYACGNKTF